MLHPAMMLRRSFITQHLIAYPPSRMSEDSAFWIRCVAKGGRFHTLAEPLIFKRRHARNSARIYRPRWEPEKVFLRMELLGLFYPQLTFQEGRAIALLMENTRVLTPEELAQGSAAVQRACLEQSAYFGEDKRFLNSQLTEYVQSIVVKINS